MFNPTFTITPTLLTKAKRIAVFTHELNKQTFSDPVITRLSHEARVISTHASTSIEGNTLLLSEVRQTLIHPPNRLTREEREVLNYNFALEELTTNGSDKKINRSLIFSVHRRVTATLLPVHQSGFFRQEPVVIKQRRTGNIVYIAPDHIDIPKLVDELVSFTRAHLKHFDPVFLAGIFHRQFVIIHPFMDGNGRTTRLLTNLLLSKMGLDMFRLFSFEDYYLQNLPEYFKKVGLFGDYYELSRGKNIDFTEWLEFFTTGIIHELERVKREVIGAAFNVLVLPPHVRQLLDFVEERGSINDQEYAQFTVRARSTRALDFRQLVDKGLLQRLGKGRATYYVRS